MEQYNPQKIELKWQRFWEENNFYQAEDFSKKPKKYILIEFPYPSGEGLHVGHCRSYVALDAVSRKKRMEGYNVLFPIGWDAFGLPTENYAIRTGIHPKIATEKNIANFKRQLKSLGLSFDWPREINTTDPQYYKWTQWIFLKLFEKGLAYQAEIPVNWCPSCKIGLANEEVVGGVCERCGAGAEKKTLKQWMFRITAYADRLIDDLEKVDYLEKIKTQQINWVGKSYGTDIKFSIPNSQFSIDVFTTRTDTLFGVTAVVLAPEHPLVEKLITKENREKVKKYIEESKKKSDFEREKLEKEKTGVFTGSYCLNPANNERVPIWIGDYVVATYGGGAVMVVPAHDYRDYDFAKKYNIPIKVVIKDDKPKGTILLVHGIYGNSQENWFPWLKQECEKIGFKVLIPNLPNAENPEMTEWLSVLKYLKKEFSEDLIIIGHSLGAPVVCKFIEENNLKVKKLILVAPTSKKQNEKNWQALRKVGASESGINRIQEFNATKLDWDKIKSLITQSTIYLSDNDPYIPLSVQDDYQLLKSEIKIFEDRGHFNTASGIKQLPEIISDVLQDAFVDYGILVNSGEFNGLSSKEAIEKITQWLEKKGLGRKKMEYKLRDWVFSRQHYWGEPIPIIHCPKCGVVPVPEKDLPVELPFVEKYQPTGTGESPLSTITEWVNVKCPKCVGPAKRETDTMPNWAGSNWYYLAYLMRGISNFQFPIFNYKKAFDYWMPVDWYNGGMEHTTLHLLYSRFIYKFLWDIGTVPKSAGPEPYQKRTSHGIVLAEDGRKMSKSFGNVINPDEIVGKYGADTLRLYEMFMGPFDQGISWSTQGVKGVYRFLEKVWKLASESSDNARSSQEILKALHKLNKKIDEDLEVTKFNTVVAAFMEFVNLCQKKKEEVGRDTVEKMLILLSPFAPHLTEELWQTIGHKESIFFEKWPKYDEKLIKEEIITLVVQVNGRVRDKIEVKADISEEEAKRLTLNRENVIRWTAGKEIKKVIFVPGKLINIVV